MASEDILAAIAIFIALQLVVQFITMNKITDVIDGLKETIKRQNDIIKELQQKP
jgi:hypothetical protein